MVDFIGELPLELAEEIIGYLDGEDVSSGCKVCKEWRSRMDRDHIWHRLCKRMGWFPASGTVNAKGLGHGRGHPPGSHLAATSGCPGGCCSWRDVYWLNYNWTHGRYKKYTINGDDLHPAEHRSFQLDGRYLVVPRTASMYKPTGLNIWDISSEPRLHQVVLNDLGPRGKQFRAYRNYIVQQIGSFVRIHIRKEGAPFYEHFKLLHFKENVSFAGGIFQVVSDVEEIENVERFTPPIFEDELNLEIEIEDSRLVVHKRKKFIYVWTLVPWMRACSVDLDGELVSFVRIASGRLFCAMSANAGPGSIRVYDLAKKMWTMELNANLRNAPFADGPGPYLLNLYLNSNLISTYLKSPTESTFKIWDTRGEIVKVIELPRSLHFQCTFAAEDSSYLLLTSSEQTVVVWSSSSSRPQVVEERGTLDLETPCEAMDAGPGQTVVLVFQKYYEVWDWKAGCRRYVIDLPMSLTRQVNEYFCVQEIHNYNHSIKINVLNFATDVGGLEMEDHGDTPLMELT